MIKKINRFFVISLIFFAIFACKDVVGDSAEVELITVEEMDKLLKLEKVQLIDVRTPEEYAEGHIAGSININFNADDFEEQIVKADKSKPVAVYCGKGGRSSRCSAFMKKAGFKKIYDLNGGITEWQYKGKPIIK